MLCCCPSSVVQTVGIQELTCKLRKADLLRLLYYFSLSDST